MLGNIQGEERYEYLRDYVVFDLETTGYRLPAIEL